MCLQSRMAVFMRERIGMERTGQTVTIPNNARAKLMYHLDCVSTVLQLNNPNMQRMCNYKQYNRLSDSEETQLLYLAVHLSPDELMGKVFFNSDALCGDSSNEFYELSQVRNTFAVSNSVIIGGQQTRVAKIMTFKMSWMTEYYIEPVQQLNRRRRQRESGSNSCVIL